MRKLIVCILGLGVISITSCKKSFTCSCYVSTATSGYTTEVNVKLKSNSSSTTHQKACEAEQVSRTKTGEEWECSMK